MYLPTFKAEGCIDWKPLFNHNNIIGVYIVVSGYSISLYCRESETHLRKPHCTQFVPRFEVGMFV